MPDVTNVAPPAAPPPTAPPAIVPEAFEAQAQNLLRAQCANLLTSTLHTSTLPPALKAVVQEQFEGKVFTPEELQRALDRQTKAFAELSQATVITGIDPQGGRVVDSMWSDLDRVQLAAERLLFPAAMVTDAHRNVEPLTGIREMYALITGDRQVTGVFNSHRSQFANANTTTMNQLVANIMNKVIPQQWAILGREGYDWYKKIFYEDDFQSLQQIAWEIVGGFADLPTVNEGGAYTELTWDDNKETSDWTKKGAYIGLTLEMIDRDQTQKIRQIPIALATAGIRTLSAACANIFTQASGAGPTLADGTALFHSTSTLRGGDGSTAGSGNLGTTALAAAEWDVAVQKIYSKTQLNASRRLATRPRYIVNPIELEKTALQIFTSNAEPSSNLFYDNVRKSSAENVVTCPELTDVNDWLAASDPNVLPCVGIGYRFGRTPELFVADDERTGSMFTNDELRIKERFFVNVGVIDWRGLRKYNV